MDVETVNLINGNKERGINKEAEIWRNIERQKDGETKRKRKM
jgi:hypothetical protein